MAENPETETTGAAATASNQPAGASATPRQPIIDDEIPEPLAIPSAQASDIKDDIASILQSTKLPERRMFGPNTTDVTSPSPAPQPTPAPPVAPASDEQSDSTSSSLVTALRTLRNDMQKIVRIDKMSLVHAASLEQNRASAKKTEAEREHPAPNPGTQQRQRRIMGVIFASVIFLALGGAALGSVFFIAQQRLPRNLTPQQDSILFAEQTIPLALSDTQTGSLKQNIATMRSTPVGSLGSITRIVPATMIADAKGTPGITPATVRGFFTALGTKAPEELLRALGDDFFFGTHTIDTNASILVFNVLSYERAFSGMLAWESTMNTDLSPIFATVSPYTMGADGIPRDRRFTDTVMRNYDVRILKDDRGATIMYYSFPAPNLLIIAESPYSFPEILTRLRAQRRL